MDLISSSHQSMTVLFKSIGMRPLRADFVSLTSEVTVFWQAARQASAHGCGKFS